MSGLCKSKVGVVGLYSLRPCLFTIFSLYTKHTRNIGTGYTSQWVKLLGKHNRVRNTFAEKWPFLIFFFPPDVLSVIAGPLSLSVIDDKEVANDTRTSSLLNWWGYYHQKSLTSGLMMEMEKNKRGSRFSEFDGDIGRTRGRQYVSINLNFLRWHSLERIPTIQVWFNDGFTLYETK